MSAVKICPQCGQEFESGTAFCPWDGSALRSVSGGGSLIGEVVAGRFLIRRELGRGGMGEVYLAEQVRIGRPCALKVIKPELVASPDAVLRFNREASNASRISHPNVVQIYDFGETPEGLIFCAMEYVEGQSLSQLLDEYGALPPGRAIAIATQVADALTAAHDLGIVHRDLKPDNIMLAASRSGADLVKVVDFGVARAMGDDSQKVTSTGLVVGTIDYMSPEQFLGDGIDGRSDLYSLAIVAFQMLAGSLPFDPGSPLASMEAKATGKHRGLGEVTPAVAWPLRLQEVLSRALESDRDRRQSSVAEFSAELQEAMREWMPEESTPQPTREGSRVTRPVRTDEIQGRSRPGVALADVPSTAPDAIAARQRATRTRHVQFGALLVVALAATTVIALRDRWAPGTPAGESAAKPEPGGEGDSGPGTGSPDRAGGGGSTKATGDKTVGDSRVTGSTKDSAESTAATVPDAELATTRATLDAIRELTRGTLTVEQARQALALLDRATPRTPLGRVEAKYYALEAHSVLGNTAEFCDLYTALTTEAVGTAFEKGISAWALLAESTCR